MSDEMKDLLKKLEAGIVRADDVYERLKGYEDVGGFAKIDVHRAKRKGFPEVIFGEGKTAEQIALILQQLMMHHHTVLATRVTKEKAEHIAKVHPNIEYDECARTLLYREKIERPRPHAKVGILCAGTSDLPVAEEAAITAIAMGLEVDRFYDVGVAGIHRLFDQLDHILACDVLIVVAGMEGALASVVGGLANQPIIAVPTSVGYGTSFNGVSALLTMLNSCASGVSVVNIDNGFGAAYQAALIAKLKESRGND